MKINNQQNLNSIITKTQDILKKFNPSIDNIKKSIENLIDREYLQKKEDEKFIVLFYFKF